MGDYHVTEFANCSFRSKHVTGSYREKICQGNLGNVWERKLRFILRKFGRVEERTLASRFSDVRKTYKITSRQLFLSLINECW
jgi:hypothetical protein